MFCFWGFPSALGVFCVDAGPHPGSFTACFVPLAASCSGSALPCTGENESAPHQPKTCPLAQRGGDRDGTGAVSRTGGFRGLTATPHRCCLNPGLSSCWVYPRHPPAVLRFGAPGVFPWTFMLGQFLVLFILPFFFFPHLLIHFFIFLPPPQRPSPPRPLACPLT